MSWTTTHRGEFYDGRSLLWRTDLELDGYTGDIAEMLMTGDPLKIEWLSSGDDMLITPVKGSVATINVWSQSHFQYTSLYSSQNLYRRVSIYYIPTSYSGLTVDDTDVTVDSSTTVDAGSGSAEGTAVLYWRGYLTSEYSEPYDDVPYRVSLTASDALGLLKDMKYDNAGTLYTGRATEALIIIRILTKIGFTEFKEFCNIYDTLMATGTGDSPLDQCQIDQDVFIDEEYNALSCYTVLEEILKKYNAVIRQINGQFYIFRPTEFTQATVYGRYFTAHNTKSSISVAPEQLIKRTGVDSDVTDFNGGVLMIQSPLSKFTAKQDYGSRESWLDNHKFPMKTWNRDTDQFLFWTHVGGQPVSFIPGLEGELEGMVMMPDGTGSTYYATQEFGIYAKACSDTFVFTFDYRLIKLTAPDATNVTFKIIVADSAFTYYLNDTDDGVNTTATWGTAYHTIERLTADVPKGLGEWQTVTYTIGAGLPIAGPYKILIFSTDTVSVSVAYRNIRFYSASEQLLMRTIKTSKWPKWANAIPPFGIIRFFGGGYYSSQAPYTQEGVEVVSRTYPDAPQNAIEAPESGQSYMLGDCEDTGIVNVIEQFRGSLCVSSVGSLIQTATDFTTSHASAYVAGGVTVTAVGNKIVFTSSVAGTDFTGATSAVNATGNLAGTAATVQANQVGQAQIETITLTGWSGSCNIGALEQVWPLDYDTSLTVTAAKFVTDYAGQFADYGITVTSDAEDIIFTEVSAAGGFTAPTITNVSINLDGTVAHTQAGLANIARIDEITLTGTSGTATVTCDGVARTATYNTATVLDYTSTWTTRGGSEDKPLIELVADEVAAQYARGKHFIQMSLRERGNNAPDVNMLYNLQDSLNTVGGSARVFMSNRGSFDVKTGEWSLDAHEII